MEDRNTKESELLEDEIFKFEYERQQFYQKKANYQSRCNDLNKQLAQAKKALKKCKKSKMRARMVCVMLCIVILVASACGMSSIWFSEKLADEGKQFALENKYKEARGEVYAPVQALQQQVRLLEKEQLGIGEILSVESTILNNSNKEELNRYVASLKRHATQTVELKRQGAMQYYQMARIVDVGEYTITDSGNSVIFPGAIIQGDSLFMGTADYTLVAAERTPIYLVSNQQNGTSIEVKNVSYGTITDALKNYQAISDQGQAKEWTYYLQSIESEEQLELSLGIKAADVGLDFSHSNTEKNATVAVVYKQTYYSVNAEPLNSAADYFENGTDFSKWGIYEPAYVASVDYGRMMVVFVTANMDISELKAGLEASIKGVDIGAALSNIKQNNQLDVEVIQLGGKANNINEIMDSEAGTDGLVDKWNQFLHGTEDSKSLTQRINDCLDMNGELVNPIPLSYSLKYLSDNAVVPAMMIEAENLIPVEDAKTVKISLIGTGSKVVPGVLQLDVPDTAGMIVSENTIVISKDGATNGEIVILWDSTCESPITGNFNGMPLTLDLQNLATDNMETDIPVELVTEESLWNGTCNTYANIHISNAVSEMQ